jgi:CheY-like chemotaxis protein
MSATVPTRILVIEGSDTSRAVMVYSLKAGGYVPLEAGDGRSGIRIAQREHPDLIICDVHSSKLDGYSVIEEIKKDDALRHVPAVAVTIMTVAGELKRILDAGFNGCVSRAIAPETFVQEIEEFLPPEKRSKAARPGESPPAAI